MNKLILPLSFDNLNLYKIMMLSCYLISCLKGQMRLGNILEILIHNFENAIRSASYVRASCDSIIEIRKYSV
jgi:hypothetical protein